MKLKTVLVLIAGVMALAVLGNVMHNIEARKAEEAEQAAQIAVQRQVKERREALAAEFVADKVPEKAQGLIDQGNPAAAQALLAKFVPLNNPEVTRLTGLAQTALKVKVLSDELAGKLDTARRMAIYQELAALEPANPLWPAMAAEVKPMVEAAKVQQTKAEAVAARQAAVKKLFSLWDGSVYSVEQAIKDRLKDPESYKHVETQFTDPGVGNVIVFTKYRARNSFNAVVLETAVAVVSPTGELVSLEMK